MSSTASPFCIGAENETRTRDPDLGKVVLYQLSYFRFFRPEKSEFVGCASEKSKLSSLGLHDNSAKF